MYSIVSRPLSLTTLRALVFAACASGLLIGCNSIAGGDSTISDGSSSGSGGLGGNGTASSSSGVTQTSYTIGGTVLGLSGTGLMLANNAGNNLTITGNGGFTFSNHAASGATYNVTIQSQPVNPSQVCSVTNGVGTVGTVNVASVTVSCTTNFYNVGGSVAGLTGSGLVLQTNGSNNVSVTHPGNFVFSTLASGSNYTVTVMTQPSNPSQTCTIANDTGQVTTADVTNVAVTCTTNNYAISGTVTGLAGTGLVLQTNGANPVAIAGNGTYTLATLPSGSAYAVTVGTPPGNPAQLCRITGGTGTVMSANVTTVAIRCTNTGRFVFLANPFANGGDGTVGAFTINPLTGALTPAGGSPYVPVELQPYSLALDPGGQFLYVANSGSNIVSTYGIAANGVLTPDVSTAVAGSPTNFPYSLAVDPSGPYLYVGSDDTVDGTVEAYSINAGVLTPVTGALGSSTYHSGNVPFGLAVDPLYSVIYATNVYDSTIAGFTIAAGGTLTPAAGSPFTAPGGIGTSAPFGIAIHPAGGIMYVTDAFTNVVTQYSYGVAGTLIRDANYVVGAAPHGIAIDPTGAFLYVSNSNAGTVSAFTIASDGTLTAMTGSPFISTVTNVPSSATPTAIQVDPSGQFAYVANGDDGTVTVFRINLTTGALTQVGAKVPAITPGDGGGPSSVVIE